MTIRQTEAVSVGHNPWRPGEMAQIPSGLPNPLRFRWGFWHVCKFSTVFQLSSWTLQITYLGMATLIARASIREDKLPASLDQYLRALLVAVILYLVFWGIQLLFNALILYKRRDRHLNLDCTLEILEGGLRFRTPLVDSLYYWPGLLKVTLQFGMMVIYVGPRSSILIPFEYFPSNAARNELVGIIETKIKECRSAA